MRKVTFTMSAAELWDITAVCYKALEALYPPISEVDESTQDEMMDIMNFVDKLVTAYKEGEICR